MDELAGSLALVAADRLGSLAVEMGQTVDVVADQDPMHGGRRHAEPKRNPVRADLVHSPVTDDPLLQPDGGSVRGGDGGGLDPRYAGTTTADPAA